jgi:phosphate transport system ATP-binding protein
VTVNETGIRAKAPIAGLAPQGRTGTPTQTETVIDIKGVDIHYGKAHAVRGVSLPVARNQITAMIGPSGCGKSTVLRSINRMNDLIPGAKVSGSISFHGQDIYAPGVDPIAVRRHIGMVFQKANPFPKSIFDNVAYGLRINGMKDNLADRVEQALRGAALWDEVKDNLKKSALALSGGQQQRLCIARAIAVQPEVLLMDEPCSALDPIATARIEELMSELVRDYTIVIVTHNMQQAARVSDSTAFFSAAVDDAGERYGFLVEFDDTQRLFSNPSDSRTEDYITGRFG